MSLLQLVMNMPVMRLLQKITPEHRAAVVVFLTLMFITLLFSYVMHLTLIAAIGSIVGGMILSGLLAVVLDKVPED